jgi:hypothetical protein
MNARRQRVTLTRVETGKDHQVIHPRNTLKQRAGVTRADGDGLDEDAIRRAEQALKALSVQFDGWMEEAARKLGTRWADVERAGTGDGRLAALHRDAHDIRGQATTLGFPLASRVGASLCLILEEAPVASLAEEPVRRLIGQHVDAIRAITREGVAKASNPIGGVLASELETIAEGLVASLNGVRTH